MPQKLLPLAAFVFDMDGLLLDSERRSQEILHIAAARIGKSLSPETMLGMVGRNVKDGPKYLEQHLGSEQLVWDLLEHFVELYEREIAEGRIPIKKGVAELLATLDELKIPRAIATSTITPVACRKLERKGLLARFDAVIGGDQVEHGKPAPDIYLKACSTLGHEPSVSWACEDSPAGFTAASTAGLRTILVPDLIQPTDTMREKAWRVATDLLEVEVLVRTSAEVVRRSLTR